MRYAVGVDGGGTKTTAVVVNEERMILGTGTAGPANYRSISMEAASADIAQAVAQAIAAAGITLSDVAVMTFCLAGFDTELDLPVPQRAVRNLEFNGPTIFENDVIGAWAGAMEARPGVVVIAGTGSTALGMNPRGQLWRTDGWDCVLGDAGSGYAIGLAGIRAAMSALDGRGEPTALVHELGTVYAVATANDMRRFVDGTRFGKFEIAAFAAHVAEAAVRGDITARDILGQAGRDLGQAGSAIIRRLGMRHETFPVGMIGSVFRSEPWVTTPFHAAIMRAAPGAQFAAPLHPPEVGAAILGLNRLAEDDTGSWTLGQGRRTIERSLRVADFAS